MSRSTKIVCTLGPAVDSREGIRKLIAAGMNVARINCSHGDWEQRRRWIEWVRELSPKVGPVAILADLQGPKMRIGTLEEPLRVEVGQKLDLHRGDAPKGAISIPSADLWSAMGSGDRLLFGDGDVQTRLGDMTAFGVEAKVLVAGTIKSKTGITLVGKSFDIQALTPKDEEDVAAAAAMGVDFIALSYLRSAADVLRLKHLIAKHDSAIRVCSKIETHDALREIEAVVRMSDVVMVARGDLGLQMDLECVPTAQKRIIRVCNAMGVPVITATQMLESMMQVPRPTRAEAGDVANAILDGTDAVMLSGETAAGKYPFEAVSIMARIAEEAETMLDHSRRLDEVRSSRAKIQVTQAVAHSAVRLAEQLGVRAIVATSTSGTTPRMVSKFRPRAPILCLTWGERTQRAMAVVWGVEAALGDQQSNMDDVARHALEVFLRAKRIRVGDLLVLASGFPTGTPGNTNLVIVETVR